MFLKVERSWFFEEWLVISGYKVRGWGDFFFDEEVVVWGYGGSR